MNSEFELEEDLEKMVDVQCGIMSYRLPLAGMTVGFVQRELSDRLNISPDAVSLIDGKRAESDRVLAAGEALSFVRHAGEMG